MILRNKNIIIEKNLFHKNVHNKTIISFTQIGRNGRKNGKLPQTWNSRAADEVLIKELPLRCHGQILPIGYFEARLVVPHNMW